MSKKELEEFKVAEVELKGSNLIEASAGTGKTFSIAILVLRLIIEKKLDLREILMVTFTKAAVAELEGRIRKFIREANKYVKTGTKCDGVIKGIINKTVAEKGKEDVLESLKKASMYLDETSIYTIHSFCQKTLTEFAFETDQLFGCDVMADDSSIVENAVNNFWRDNITTKELEELRILDKNGLNRLALADVVKNSLSGKKYIYDEEINIEESFKDYNKANEAVEEMKDKFENQFKYSDERSLENINGNRYAIKTFSSVHNDVWGFYEALKDNASKKYVEKLFPDLLQRVLDISEKEEENQDIIKNIIYFIYGTAIDTISEDIEHTKASKTVFTYDDLIQNLHKAATGEKADPLRKALQNKYKCVFIDEFQDTDKMQYELFHSLFDKEAIIFYIGDPKQSIYSFRGADIDTYKKAAEHVDHGFTMRRNFRSTKNLIAGLNQFFTSLDNPFGDDKIGYEVIEAALNFPEIHKYGEPEKAISVIDCPKKTEIHENVARNILRLLRPEEGFTIKDKAIKASDIAVLVRTKNEAKEVKKELTKLNVPAVTLDDTKVLESDEATTVYYILYAVQQINKSNISRALLNRLVGFSKEDLFSLNDEEELLVFKDLMKAWEKNGVYACLSLFVKHYKVRSNILDGDIENGERSLTNLLQIIELLHKTEVENTYSPEDLLGWMQRIFEGAEQDGDEYAQRIESDEDAVNIVTIHKSKGLAYKIVFAPYLNLKSDFGKRSMIEYKDKNGEYCFSHDINEEKEKLYKEQTEKENRRLIYVALTRAVHKCYIYNTPKDGIAAFIKSCKASDFIDVNTIQEIEVESLPRSKQNTKNNNEDKDNNKDKTKKFNGSINGNWTVSSFSAISKIHATFKRDNSIKNKNYDEFAFSTMPKGSLAGLFLHEIFENAYFAGEDFQKLITKIGTAYPTIFDEQYIEDYNSLVHHTLGAICPTPESFKLKEVEQAKIIPELEFFFDVKKISTGQLKEISDIVQIDDYRTIEGAMTGFVDLFFEHKGKYYILDWKSNFLGNSLDNYTHEKMDEAMRGNNYHLQHLIYTVAVKRYLESRLPNFDYERDFGGCLYIFLRGCRKDKSSGMFYTKTPTDTIKALEALF